MTAGIRSLSLRTVSRTGIAVGMLCTMTALAKTPPGVMPDLVPMPKIYRPADRVFSVDRLAIFTADGERQGEIAARELTLRITELGGTPGTVAAASDGAKPGIYVLPISHPVGRERASALGLGVTEEEPGPQGYVIQTTDTQIVVLGSDSIGALYGAMTLRQMMFADTARGPAVAAAYVHDKPDYRYRANNSFERNIKYLAVGETMTETQVGAYKAALDWMLRLKMNLLSDYMITDPRDLSSERRAFLAEVNAYAVERGIHPGQFINTAVALGTHDKGPEFDQWDCYVLPRRGTRYYCWSRDELARKRAETWADFFRECNFRFCYLHPVDGGGINDPELWSRRCPQCRERWADDERWQASIHQFNLWMAVMRERAPAVKVSSPVYPYAASYASRAIFPDTSEELWRMNSIDYWDKVHRGTDPDLIPMTWAAERSLMDTYRSHWAGRPICIYAHSFVSLGYFGTWHRNCKTNFYGNPNDIFYNAAGHCLTKSRWMNLICSNEFAWNTLAPGHEHFTGLYYDAEKDHTEPKEIIDEWLPRACRAFFGPEVGERIAPVFQLGVQPLYIMNPGLGIDYANKQRRRPLAAVDPTREEQDLQTGRPFSPDLIDSPERMALQVRATKAAMTALDAANEKVNTLDTYRRKLLMYYTRRMPVWYLIARARHACYVAADLQRQAMYEAAAAVLQAALASFEHDYAHAREVIEQTKDLGDLVARSPLDPKNRDVYPSPEEVKALLLERLASASVVLRPRRAGEVVRVAIHTGLGQNGTKAFFDQFRNVEAEIINSLSLAVLDRFDAVFILQTKSVDRADYFHNLGRYVREGGGGVLFQHDMCGFGRYVFGRETPFPEICPFAAGRKDAVEVVVAENHPTLPGAAPGAVFTHMYYDHIIPKPGPDAVTVAVDRDGDPVVVVGTVGHGKVIFDGNVNLTAANGDELLTDFNALLAQGAVEWFTGVRLEKR